MAGNERHMARDLSRQSDPASAFDMRPFLRLVRLARMSIGA
jgi:hypothetical protein